MRNCTLPQITDIITGHDGYLGAPTSQLENQSFTVWYHDRKQAIIYSFESASHITVTCPEGARELEASSRSYEAFQIDDGMYFVDFDDVSDFDSSTSIIIDTHRMHVLEIETNIPSISHANSDLLTRMKDNKSLSCMTIRYSSGIIEGGGKKSKRYDMPFEFPRTNKLVGLRVLCAYSDTHIYDHIYISRKYMCWFCIEGPDRGLGDFDECDYFELAPDIFLVCWKEKLLPMAGITVENYKTMRSIGKIVGLDVNTNSTSKITVGAILTVLNKTEY